MRRTKKQIENEILQKASQILEARAKYSTAAALTEPAAVKALLIPRLRHLEHEVFCVIYLNNQHKLIEIENAFTGTIDGCSVYPREIAKRALELNTAAVIFAHNHPSGVTNPSSADRRITDRLKAALQMFDIRVLDHVIIGEGEYSFAEGGDI
jgi:DNA repair protein RadC